MESHIRLVHGRSLELRVCHTSQDRLVQLSDSDALESRMSKAPKEPVRPAFLCPGWPPQECANGIVTSVSHVVSALSAMGYSTTVFSNSNTTRAPNVHVLDSKLPIRERVANRIASFVRVRTPLFVAQISDLRRSVRRLGMRGSVSILEMEESFGWATSIVGRTGLPTIVRLHGPWFLTGSANGLDIDKPEHAQRIASEGRGIAAADGVTAPSMEVLERVREFYSLELSNARVIPNPIGPTADEELWRQNHADPTTVLFVGRFDRLKGADVVLEAFNILAKRRKKLTLQFCGPDAGFKDDSGVRVSFAHYVAKTISDPSIRARVKNYGQLQPAEIAGLRKRAGVTVMASRWEAFGYVVLEAMSCGVPFVGTKTGGVPELIQHQQNGLLAVPGDATSLAQQIQCLLDSPQLAKRLGEQAVKDARKRYSPQLVAQATLDYYREVSKMHVKKNRG